MLTKIAPEPTHIMRRADKAAYMGRARPSEPGGYEESQARIHKLADFIGESHMYFMGTGTGTTCVGENPPLSTVTLRRRERVLTSYRARMERGERLERDSQLEEDALIYRGSTEAGR
eukprot:g25965.t1